MQKQNLEQLKNYRLLDDDFMTVIFKNSDCAELLLRIVLNKPDIRVIDVQTQDYFKNLENIIKSFRQFACQTSRLLIVNGDDANSLKAVEGLTHAQVVTFGFD